MEGEPEGWTGNMIPTVNVLLNVISLVADISQRFILPCSIWKPI